jgi:hypothetical protein
VNIASSRYLSPFDDRTVAPIALAPRPDALADVRVGLLDISKPKGDVLLDRVERLLGATYGVAEVVRLRKPTFARPAPPDVLSEADRCGAILVALAD